MVIASQSSDAADLGKATDLLNQQIWCWGQDIMRPEGNWLIAVGFERLTAPTGAQYPSLYTLKLPHERHVILRGFGVLYTDTKLGSIFLPRYNFKPLYTKQVNLNRPLWTKADLPRLKRPARNQRQAFSELTSGLIQWIWRYEADVAERLGTAYRRATLIDWDDGAKAVVPAEHVVSAWHALSSGKLSFMSQKQPIAGNAEVPITG